MVLFKISPSFAGRDHQAADFFLGQHLAECAGGSLVGQGAGAQAVEYALGSKIGAHHVQRQVSQKFGVAFSQPPPFAARRAFITDRRQLNAVAAIGCEWGRYGCFRFFDGRLWRVQWCGWLAGLTISWRPVAFTTKLLFKFGEVGIGITLGIVTLIEVGRNGLQQCPFRLPRSRNPTH